MNIKDIVVKNKENIYILPRHEDMKVDAIAFLSESLFASSEVEMWEQIKNGASYEGVVGAYLMPDCHLGFGVPVGSVVVTDDTLIQACNGYDISCFTADTKVSLVDGRELSFSELIDLYTSNEEFYVYSYAEDGKITAGKASNPRLIKENADIIEVELDNGEHIKCTPDHQFLMRDGNYKMASQLQPNDSLMPLYRSYDNGYCCVQHPIDNSIEKMYKVSFREFHGYLPSWPMIIHHDIFNEKNLNPSKINDDPKFLVEMNEKDHFTLHSKYAKERLANKEIWGAKAHKLYPEMYSKMASENMKRLHADPEFKKRHAKRMSETNKRVRAAGGYKEANKLSGARGAKYLIEYNLSEKGRETSREVGKRNKGRKMSPETIEKIKIERKNRSHKDVKCPYCDFVSKNIGVISHVRHKHNNHKVVKISLLENKENVYCLTVDKYHNFALTSGVFVHNCGILHMKVPGLTAGNVKSKYIREQWIKSVEDRVATGVGSGRPSLMPNFTKVQGDEILRYGAKAVGIDADLCERQFIAVPEDMDFSKIKVAYDKVLPQLGSVGAGNHFIELQVDRDTGEVWVMIHCGSRGYGWQTANHFFFEGAKARGLPSKWRESSWLKVDEQVGRDYWNFSATAANYAVANRHIIVQGIQEALREVFNVEGEVYYEISHNLVQQETLVLPDGSTKKGFVHRKGATRAFPAGHPDLVGTAWEKTGHPCLIPGSMFHGAAILFPQEGAYKTACSVNHGSGRIIGRKEAKRKMEHKQDRINEEMRDIKRDFNGVSIEGIVGNFKNVPIDECQHVYKNLDEVLNVLEVEGIAKIAHRLYPVANLKGTD